MNSEFATAYEATCKDVADRDGLTELQSRLTAVGVTSEIEQTGGFCMVLVVRHGEDGALTAVSRDGDFLVCFYDSELAWEDGDADVLYFETVDEVVAELQK